MFKKLRLMRNEFVKLTDLDSSSAFILLMIVVNLKTLMIFKILNILRYDPGKMISIGMDDTMSIENIPNK